MSNSLASRDDDLQNCLELLNKDELVGFLKDLIKIDSSYPPGDEIKIAKKVKEKLEEQNIETEISDLEESNRANLISIIGEGPSQGPTLVYCGHFDVVPAGPGWSYDPFGAQIYGDLMFGRGTCDMKAGVAAMVMAICILKKSGIPLKGSLVFLGTSGEETNLCGSRSYVKRYGVENIDALAISEASNNDFFVAEKGALWLKLISKGKESHGGQPKQGINALKNMIEFLNNLNKDFEFDKIEDEYLSDPTLTLTSMHSGGNTNIVPDRCEATLDIRTVPGNENQRLLEKVERILFETKIDNKTIDISIDVQQSLVPILTDIKNPFIQQAIYSYKQIFNKNPKLKGVSYYTDAVPFREANPKLPLLIYGPGDYTRNHKKDEYIELSSVFDATRFYVALALNFLK